MTPVTNPTSTVLFKALIALKPRNPVVFSFHPAAQRCSAEAARVVRDASLGAGAPEERETVSRVPPQLSSTGRRSGRRATTLGRQARRSSGCAGVRDGWRRKRAVRVVAVMSRPRWAPRQ
ncbi:hypothetical protein OK074_7934 [Actinobacteria bacterium OK074]|nr:hypothetical protein OK074_7934 [Actinobacteria bacterium OK074]